MFDYKKPTILITNDDGINAPGIRFLISVASEFGNVVVIAPREGMSGMAHAITTKSPLRYKTLPPNGAVIYVAVEGTPVDCVKIALRRILKGKPDLLLSGINHGSNASVNIIYSGTMAAAFEGAMAGIPSVGFSLNDFDHKAPLEHLRHYIAGIISDTLNNGLPPNVCLNVNIPVAERVDQIKGVKVCRQAIGYWQEEFEERIDPHEQPYFWLKGTFVNTDNGNDTDLAAMENNWISVVPVHFDFTAFASFPHFHGWQSIGQNLIESTATTHSDETTQAK